MLYFSLIHPYMQYCILVWGSTYPSNLNRIVLPQKKVVRINLDLDLLKKLLEWQFETSWKTQVYIVEGNSKMYIEITDKLILQVTNYYNKIYE